MKTMPSDEDMVYEVDAAAFNISWNVYRKLYKNTQGEMDTFYKAQEEARPWLMQLYQFAWDAGRKATGGEHEKDESE